MGFWKFIKGNLQFVDTSNDRPLNLQYFVDQKLNLFTRFHTVNNHLKKNTLFLNVFPMAINFFIYPYE